MQRRENAFHVFMIVTERTVFVLDLHGDDGSAVRNLQRRQFPAQSLKPALRRGQEFFVGAAQDNVGIGEEPCGQAAEIPLSAGIRTGAQDHVETFLLRDADERRNIERSGEVIDSRLGLVQVPENIGRNGVQSHGARLLEAIAPVFARDALVVHFAGDDLQGLAVEHEVVALDADVVRRLYVLGARSRR